MIKDITIPFVGSEEDASKTFWMKCQENKNIIKRAVAGFSIAAIGTVLIYNSGSIEIEGDKPVALAGSRYVRDNIDSKTTYFY